MYWWIASTQVKLLNIAVLHHDNVWIEFTCQVKVHAEGQVQEMGDSGTTSMDCDIYGGWNEIIEKMLHRRDSGKS